jgi:hypothetical protein
MGRIHRYGQDKDCLIFNFVAINTSEGKVLWKLFERIRAIEIDLDPERTGKVFNVLGDIFPANQLERMMREMYAHNLTEAGIMNRIVQQVDTEHFRKISDSALEGLAKRELNLSQIISKSAEAKERRLVPEVIHDFFVQAAPIAGIHPKETAKGKKIYRIGRVPRTLWGTGDRLENRFGKLGRDYKKITFDKNILTDDPTLEWVTPGHPLFECVRDEVSAQVQEDLRRGAIFLDLHSKSPARLDVFSAAITDGRYTLEFDAARKIAQGLGAHLEQLTRLVEVKGSTARLLPVSERTKYLFGKEEAQTPSKTKGKKGKKKEPEQLNLFAVLGITETEEDTDWGEKNVPQLGNTTLDCIHQSMILFAAGRSEALKRFLVDEGAGKDQRFWGLAQALSALYPTGTEEKRWVDGVLARKKGLGFS